MTDSEHTNFASVPRLFVDAMLAPDALIPLSAEQTHYLLRVMRLAGGQDVALFNGSDGLWRGRIEGNDRRRVSIQLVDRIAPQPPSTGPWLAFAVPKRPAMEAILQKGTELGVSRFFPISSARTMVDRLNADRLTRIAAEAAEQCERLDVPWVESLLRVSDLLAGWPAPRRLFWCDETGQGIPLADAADGLLDESENRGEGADAPMPLWGLMIGPEGGFAPEELDGLSEVPFVTRVTIGPRIMRADTAAIAALAIGQALVGDGHLPVRTAA